MINPLPWHLLCELNQYPCHLLDYCTLLSLLASRPASVIIHWFVTDPESGQLEAWRSFGWSDTYDVWSWRAWLSWEGHARKFEFFALLHVSGSRYFLLSSCKTSVAPFELTTNQYLFAVRCFAPLKTMALAFRQFKVNSKCLRIRKSTTMRGETTLQKDLHPQFARPASKEEPPSLLARRQLQVSPLQHQPSPRKC